MMTFFSAYNRLSRAHCTDLSVGTSKHFSVWANSVVILIAGNYSSSTQVPYSNIVGLLCYLLIFAFYLLW
jgi:hypothetical protein